MPKATSSPKALEASLKELEQIVTKMEKGGLSLEDSLSQFEKGVTLIRACQNLLKQAEQKISLYNKEKDQLEDFSHSLAQKEDDHSE